MLSITIESRVNLAHMQIAHPVVSDCVFDCLFLFDSPFQFSLQTWTAGFLSQQAHSSVLFGDQQKQPL